MAQSYSPSLVTKNLVFCGDAAMKSAAGPATLLYDKVSNNNGTMYNGSCIDLDGTNDYVTNTSFTGHQSSSGTIVAWAKADSLSGGNYFFGVGGTTTYGSNRTMRLYLNKLSLVSYGSGTEDYNDFGPTLVTGQWYHFAYVWSGTSVTGYVDGVGYSTTLSGLVTPTGTNVTAGQAPWGGTWFNGQVADARVYNVALSAANMKELYDDSKVIIPTKNDASGGFVAQTNLKCWWPMIDGGGTIAYDGSGNGKDGTLTNMDAATDWLTGQTGCPQLVEGYNRPMLFDGLAGVGGDYVSIPLTVPADNYTVSSWVNFGTSTLLTYLFDMRDATYTGAMGVYTEESSNKHRIQVYMGGARITTGYVISENVWTHLCLTKGGADLELFIDGVSVGTDGGNTNPTNSATFFLGGRYNDANHFDGLINEVAVYDTALTLAQVQALATTGPNGGPLPPDAMSMGGDVAEQISAKSSNAVESTYSYGGTTYKTWTYRSSGTFVVPREIEVDVVVVGGGGGGGYNVGGGGGAGGLVSETLTAVAAAGGTSYSVVVGAGGEGMYGGKSPASCTSGTDSYISIGGATTAVGGGRAGGYITSWSDGPQSGGSGGGGRHSQAGAAGTAGQGKAGGSGTTSAPSYAGGGGGGAGAVGANALFSSPTIAAGDGGNGKNDFINSSVAETAALLAAALPTVGAGYLAGGGGGSRQGTGTIGAGGLGGGGKGSYYSTADGENGQVNTGGGGGAEKDGGSGVVIIRYAVPTPVGYWRNDGGVSYGWADLSGNSNTGTVYGSPDSLLFKQGINGSTSTSTGRDNQGFPLKFKNVGAVGFNGSNNYVGLGSDVTFKASGGWTVESWVMPDAASAGPYNIIGSTAYDYNSWFWSLFSNKLAMWDLSPGGVWKYGNTSLLVGQWYHTVLVSDPDNTSYYIYLNGEDDMSAAWAAYNGSWQPSKAGLKVRYIGRGNSAAGRYWNGQLSGAKFYDRALTQAEIQQNYKSFKNRFGK